MQDESMIRDIIDAFKQDGNKTISFLKGEYAVLKAGRANPHMLDKVMVDYYGTMTPISQMANIAIPEARMMTISLWDQSAMVAVRKAIQIADLGVSPADDGRMIRLVFPALTEERRRDIVKQVKKLAEDSKISLRNARKECMDFLKQVKKDGGLSEDEMSGLEKEVQKIIDQYNERIDSLAEGKEKEVMEI